MLDFFFDLGFKRKKCVEHCSNGRFKKHRPALQLLARILTGPVWLWVSGFLCRLV